MDVGDVYNDPIKQCILNTSILARSTKGMTTKFINRVGLIYGRLTVLEEAGRSAAKKVLWKCACICGNTKIVTSGDLATGNTLSCGCYLKERITKHGGWKNASYNSWRAMLRRCTNPQDKDFARYGAKGISVCQDWYNYTAFKDAMGEPTGVETLDRIDPTGNYEPGNTRWASPTTQARNTRVPKQSKTGHTGVLFHNGKYYATITVQKKKYYSKVFSTVEEAAEARKELEQRYW